jgi:diguanylate cyclase (GGDEF)-like protein
MSLRRFLTFSPRALSRLATAGLGVVLLFMASVAIGGAVQINAASHATTRAIELADAYERARYAVAGEESLERKYRLEPGPEVRSRFRATASAYADAMVSVGRFGDEKDRRLVRDLLSRQHDYLTATNHLFAAVDAKNPRKVLAIDARETEPRFAVIEERVNTAARTHRLAALHQTATLSSRADLVQLVTPIAFVVGLSLLAVFGLLLVTHGRREAEREVTIGVLARVAAEDLLTGLANRRKLTEDLEQALAEASETAPWAVSIFDLDGFKSYNDAFGHPAGDVLLARLGRRLGEAMHGRARAYRLGGDEFCVLAPGSTQDVEHLAALAADALTEHGDGFAIGCSYGMALLPQEAAHSEEAMRLADQRLYVHKHHGRVSARSQSSDVLLAAMSQRHPGLTDHNEDVALLAVAVAERLQLTPESIAEVRHGAQLHDVGKVAIPDAILNKPGPLDDEEWTFIRRHTITGERILYAAPALGPVAKLVRASHEHYDGRGYPDRLAGENIPLGSRIIAACDAYDAMTSDRPYKPGMTTEAAADELKRCSGSQFDPTVVAALTEILSLRLVG